MNKSSVTGLFYAALISILVPGCSPTPSQSPEEIAESILRRDIQNQSQAYIRLISFRKLDGQTMNVFGVDTREIRFEATLEFAAAGWWLSGYSGHLDYKFVPGTQAINGAFQPSPPISVTKDSQVIISGTIEGNKTDNGWQFSVASSSINPGQVNQKRQ
jgi:hypothetical protein